VLVVASLRLPAAAVVGPVVAAADPLAVVELVELAEMELVYSEVPDEVGVESGVDPELAGRQQQQLVVAGAGASWTLELACSGSVAGSSDFVDPAGCFLLVLEHLPDSALPLAGPSISAVDAERVSQGNFKCLCPRNRKEILSEFHTCCCA
jgi:hypothetical protein